MSTDAKIGLISLGATTAGILLFAPIWRMGTRKTSGFDFIWSHTIFSKREVEFIPYEELTEPLTEEEWKELFQLRGKSLV